MINRLFCIVNICILLTLARSAWEEVQVNGESAKVTSGKRIVWIDCDPAAGVEEQTYARDVDDVLALIQSFRSSEKLDIRGVSIVFGNAAFEETLSVGKEIVDYYSNGLLQAIPGASSKDQLGVETKASEAIVAALHSLEAEKITILALGPLTNIATVVMNHPELISKIEEVVAVAGRRPTQRFTVGDVNPLGHRDFNFEMDWKAFQTLLDNPKIKLVLVPFEISSKFWISHGELDHLEAKGDVKVQKVAAAARPWLNLWKEAFEVEGFNPYDTLAAGYLLVPQLYQCDDYIPIEIHVLPDDGTDERFHGKELNEKEYLLVSRNFKSTRTAKYCHTVDIDRFKLDLFDRLLRT